MTHASRITHHASRIPRVACFTPLPPAPSGIAQYSAELLPLLGQALDLDVYIDDYRPSVELPGVRLRPAGEFERTHRARPYDAIVYQMGNSPAHAYMWRLATRHPGLLVLHDYVLHHLHVWLAVNRRQVNYYRSEMAARYGDPGSEAALKTLRGQMPASVFNYPLCERLVEASRAVAVHNAYAAALARERTGRTDIEQIPMGVPLYQLPERADARLRLGLPADTPVVASLGEMSPHKRMDVALRALVRARKRHPNLVYVVAGRESPGLNLDRQVRMLGLEGAVRRLGYIAEATVPDLLAAVDLVVNLRYPTAGETSASLLRIMAAGQAVVVTRAGSMAETPADACAMVAPDAVEEELLAEIICRLIEDRPLRDRMASNARSYVEREHTLPISAASYLRVLGRMLGRDLPAQSWGPVTFDARAGGPSLVSPDDAPPSIDAPAGPLSDAVADAIGELRLDRWPGMTRAAAAAMVDLNLGPHKTGAGG
jgi:glycosyltransferase involved in cell wall biosynthesis